MLSRPVRRAAAGVLLGATVSFVVLVVLAMRAYPGGTAWDPTTSGHGFWSNYLCDLERHVALNGKPNLLGASALWLVLPDFFPERVGLGHAARRLGLFSALVILLVSLFPSDAFPGLHPLFMLAAGAPGIAAAGACVVGLWLGGAFPLLALLGGEATLVASVDLGLYVRQQVTLAPPPLAIASIERLALLLALLWQVLVSCSAFRGLQNGIPKST